MLIRCVINKTNQVSSQSRVDSQLRQSVDASTGLLDISIGKLYAVYAVHISVNSRTSYFIADDNYGTLWYPLSYPSCFFDIIDGRISSCWNLGFQRSSSKSKTGREALISFKEWVVGETFFEDLVDGSAREVGLFKQYKAFMDMEFPSPCIADRAELIEDKWVLCPNCCEAWMSDVTLGMVECPQCSSVLLNPRYSCTAPDFLDR